MRYFPESTCPTSGSFATPETIGLPQRNTLGGALGARAMHASGSWRIVLGLLARLACLACLLGLLPWLSGRLTPAPARSRGPREVPMHRGPRAPVGSLVFSVLVPRRR